jgi:hypothetical protein
MTVSEVPRCQLSLKQSSPDPRWKDRSTPKFYVQHGMMDGSCVPVLRLGLRLCCGSAGLFSVLRSPPLSSPNRHPWHSATQTQDLVGHPTPSNRIRARWRRTWEAPARPEVGLCPPHIATLISLAFVIPPLVGVNPTYSGPKKENVTACQCSSVYYSLLSACANCQGHSSLRFVVIPANFIPDRYTF